ncbi:MAG TPA: SulP family inorganic anion transporter [Trichormus sp.]
MPNLSSISSWRIRPLVPDLLASIVVFFVALPLCMAIAIACGVSPLAGILTGIVGGLIVGCLGGSPLQISGPAAGLVIVVADLVREHGTERLGAIVLVAGIIQVLAGSLRLAQWFRAVTPAIINGMLTGIGVLIFASQFHVMVDDVPKGSGINNLASIPGAIGKALVPNSATSHQEAAALGLATIIIILLWEKLIPKRWRKLPGSLVAISVATLLCSTLQLPVHHVSFPDSLWSSVHWPASNHFWVSLTDGSVLSGGLMVALVASAETLLTAAAIDKMHSGARTNYERELSAQGVGNMICGLLCALPMTGVMVRSGVNVGAGAKTRLSGMLHGMWLLIFVGLFPSLLKLVPVSCLAALLVLTGYKLANFKVAKELAKFGKSEVAIYTITAACIVAIDLLSGVLIGVTLAIAKLLYTFAHIEVKIVDDQEKNRTDLWLSGTATFLNLPKVASSLDTVRQDTELHIHLQALDYVDHACLDLIMSWDKQHRAAGGSLVIDWSTLGAVFRERRQRRGQFTREFRRAVDQPTSAGADRHHGQCAEQPSVASPAVKPLETANT